MSYLVIAALFGFLLAVFNNIGDLFTIADFESIHGPIIGVPRDNIQSVIDGNNNLRNAVLSVTFEDNTGTKKHMYLKAPSNIMSMTDSSKNTLLLKAIKRSTDIRARSILKTHTVS